MVLYSSQYFSTSVQKLRHIKKHKQKKAFKIEFNQTVTQKSSPDPVQTSIFLMVQFFHGLILVREIFKLKLVKKRWEMFAITKVQ